ncbi:MAG: hypothetical protein ACYTKD_26960 [Planctomycetota bacterium]|jgi:hypothetical protein
MKRIAIYMMGPMIAVSALAAGRKPQLDDEARAVIARRIETREERMRWWRDARFGMFVHVGYSLYSSTPHM